jgi:serine/threonine protein phosphatase PrpC
MEIAAAGKTDVGLIRKRNEDAFSIDPSLGLLVVADGMGGHVAGRIASKMATNFIKRYYKQRDQAPAARRSGGQEGYSETTNTLAAAIRAANAAVYAAAQERPGLKGMGTTVAAVQVNGRRLSIAHIGDSRVYLVRAGDIEQLTDDHSVVYEQVKRSLITKEEARQSEIKNVLTRALGIAAEAEVDLAEMTLVPDDILLLCSDGLSNMVEDETMLTVVTATRDPTLACEQLVSLANANGGKDNVTVIVAYVIKKNWLSYFVANCLGWLRR